MSTDAPATRRPRGTRQPLFISAIILLAAVVTLVDAVHGVLSLPKLCIGSSMLLLGITFLMEPRWPMAVAWMRRGCAVLAVGYFVFWALE